MSSIASGAIARRDRAISDALFVAQVACALGFGVALLITGGGIVVAIAVGRLRGLGIGDPMVRASFAVLCKGVPQVTLGWNILREGGAGIAVFAIIAGHLIISMRLAQIAFSIRAVGWDRNRLGIAIGEAANELSWIVATVAWIISN